MLWSLYALSFMFGIVDAAFRIMNANLGLEGDAQPNVFFLSDVMKTLIQVIPYGDLRLHINSARIRYTLPDDIFISWQIEHNLVLKGGRGVSTAQKVGKVKSIFNTSEKYLVRYPEEKYFKSFDLVADYSMPNIYNLFLSRYYTGQFFNNFVYVPPLIYNYSTNMIYNDKKKSLSNNRQNRSILCLGLFTPTTYNPGTRRFEMLKNITNAGVTVTLIAERHGNHQLEQLYSNSKIVVNIHQTDYHHTLEEMRIFACFIKRSDRS